MNTVRHGPRTHSFIYSEGIKLLPQIMKEAGYSTFNHGKTDYNFVWENDKVYSKIKLKGQADSWEILKQTNPSSFNSKPRVEKSTPNLPAERTDPSTVTGPADYPRTIYTAKSWLNIATRSASMMIILAKFWRASRHPVSKKILSWFTCPIMGPITWSGTSKCRRRVAFTCPSCSWDLKNGCPSREPARTWSARLI